MADICFFKFLKYEVAVLPVFYITVKDVKIGNIFLIRLLVNKI